MCPFSIVNNLYSVKFTLTLVFLLACPKPRDLTFGYYNEDRAGSYIEGQKVSFSCNDYRIRTPSDGIIECGPNGWKTEPFCHPQ